jgi:hypothetical protein
MPTYNNILAELEELITSASRANTEVISNAAKFISRIDRSNLKIGSFRASDQQVLSETLLEVTKINVKYISDLLNLSVKLARRLNGDEGVTPVKKETPPAVSSISAFEIKASSATGEKALVSFLVGNEKDEPVLCTLENTPFQLIYSTENVYFEPEVTYLPQAFEILKDQPVRVDVIIKVPEDVVPGTYKSKITAKDYDYIHCSVFLEVTAPKHMIKPETTVTKVASKKKTGAIGEAKKKAVNKSSTVKKAK